MSETWAGKRVLVIDDDAGFHQLITLALRKQGMAVEGAIDGKTGLGRVRTWAPDLVLLDIHLTGMDGIEVCRQLRDFSDVPVLFLSGFEDKQRIHQALAWGDGYLLKPFSLHDLWAHIQTILHDSAAQGAGR